MDTSVGKIITEEELSEIRFPKRFTQELVDFLLIGVQFVEENVNSSDLTENEKEFIAYVNGILRGY